MVMKHYFYTASVKQGSNKILSNSNSDWSKVTPGSLIKFPEDDVFYTVVKNDKVFITKKFDALDTRRLRIKENCETLINRGDSLTISYSEYELSTILSIAIPGKNYKVDDEISVIGGSPIVDINSNIGYSTKLVVKDVDQRGGITAISLKDRGRYGIRPEMVCKVSGGNGDGAIFNLTFNIIKDLSVLNREVQLINNNNDHSIIIVDYHIPTGVTGGSLTIEKWELTIRDVYISDSKENQPYEVYNHFTPNYHLPIPVKGSLSTETIIKEAFFTLDLKIKELETQILELKKLS